MHARTWLSALSLPLVAAFTWPVATQKLPSDGARNAQAQDPLAGLTDIETVLDLVKANYVDRPDMPKVIGGGIQALLERAHPYNSLLTPEDLRAGDPGPASTGLTVVKRGIYAQVLAVVPGGPADQAGMQVGDVIRRVNDEPIGPISSWRLERMLRGQVGAKVDLFRYAAATADLGKVTVTMETPKSRAVEARSTEQGSLVTIPDLKAGRANELKAALAKLDRAKPLVLDLRGDTEGDLTEAAAVAGLFDGSGPFVTIQDAGKPDRAVSIEAAHLPPFKQLIVLQGPNTIGAAEALAACLKKNGATLVGERTPGLGVAMTKIPLREGGAVQLVTERWIGDGGEKLDRQGVAPTRALRLGPKDDPLQSVLAALATPAPVSTRAKQEHA
ncbi:MAG: PDZ domain-containing protein [Acidobacteria bacterium]|nr:PDZ domain-containing protein [Acidobacteriota bacterium]